MDPESRGGQGPRRPSSPARSPGRRRLAPVLDRRQFLVTLGGAAAYATLRPGLAWAEKAGLAAPPLQPWSLPDEPAGNGVELAKAVIAAGVLAPSHWNTQPWRMESEGESIRLVADTGRAMPVNDPDQRSMLVSLGASLENMLIALRAYGYYPKVDYFPQAGPKLVVASVTWGGRENVRDRLLFGAIPRRRTNRRGYDERGIHMQNRAALSAQIPADVHLHWLDEPGRIRALADLVRDATEAQAKDKRAQAEQFAWMRFGGDDARRHGDGVTVGDLEFGGPVAWFAGRTFNPKSRFQRFGVGSAGRQARGLVRSAGTLALLTVPVSNPLAWVNGGQAYERFALRATTLGIAHQPMHAPIEVARYRGDLLKAFGAIGEEPLMLLRLGHAKAPEPSVRRAVSVVASFRSS